MHSERLVSDFLFSYLPEIHSLVELISIPDMNVIIRIYFDYATLITIISAYVVFNYASRVDNYSINHDRKNIPSNGSN